MPIRLIVDAMPVLVGRGGISNYICPLLEHFCRLRGRDIHVIFHWRIFGKKRRERFLSLRPELPDRFPDTEHVCTHVPDRLLEYGWRTPLPVLRTLSIPRGHVYFATTTLMPYHAPFPRTAVMHDVTPAMIPEYFAEPRERYVRRVSRYCHACAMLLAVSGTTADNVAEVCKYPRQNIRVAYPGLPEPPPGDEERDAEILRRFQVRKPFAVYLGALAPNKNVDGLLRAFGAFHRRGFRDWQLVVAGKDFVGADFWKRIVREEGIEQAVRFTGWIDEERWAFLRRAEILLHLSWYEGFPVPVMEALSLGLPALVSNRGPFPEALPNPPQLVDPADPEAAGQRLAEFAADAHIRKSWADFMRRRARDFSWEKTAGVLEDAVRRLASGEG